MAQSHLHLWYAALADPIGVKVYTNKRNSLVAALGALRKEACDPELDGLSIVRSPTSPDEIWILKREPKLNGAAEE